MTPLSQWGHARARPAGRIPATLLARASAQPWSVAPGAQTTPTPSWRPPPLPHLATVRRRVAARALAHAVFCLPHACRGCC